MTTRLVIDLAAGHKTGLVVSNPVILAAGSVGGGESRHAELELDAVGAIVVGPITDASRAGSEMPRLAEVPGGFVLETGLQNRGMRATIREFAPMWQRLRMPVIAQLADAHAETVARVAGRLAETGLIAGFELRLSGAPTDRQLRASIEAIQRESELPVWVKTPLERAVEWCRVTVEAGAQALVVAAGAEAAVVAGGFEPAIRRGQLYGPVAFPLMLRALADVADLGLPLPLIACGGIHTLEQARQALQVGARAIQLDSVAWIEPKAVGQIARRLAD